LLKYDIVVEDFGGDVQCAEISAKSGLGMDIFLEKILIQADVMQLTTSQNATLEGSIIESSIDKGIGSAAIAIIRNGNISVGDFVVAGGSWGKVRLLTDDRNNRISQAFAGVPIKVIISWTYSL
jgi:translation initiation factor IF-2